MVRLLLIALMLACAWVIPSLPAMANILEATSVVDLPLANSIRISPKTIIEYPLPAAEETHELIAVDAQKMIVISQQSDSSLLKVSLNPETGAAQSVAKFVIRDRNSGLHGLANSTVYPGKIWCTLQYSSELLLMDPVVADVQAPPKIEQRISLPEPARGPHVVVEYGDDLWVTLKDSHHVIRINHRHPDDYRIYKSARNPIFVARNSNSNEFYASQDQSSKILRINPKANTTEEIEIPEELGKTPVGLIEGPDKNVWFVLLGDDEGGTGTFGRILKDGTIQWFQLKNALGKRAGLIHLQFDTSSKTEPAKLWLLSSSIVSPNVMDALFEVRFNEDYKAIDTISTNVFPTQLNKSHRILPLKSGIYATELAVSALAHLASDPASETKRYDETTDYYAAFGLGIDGAQADFRAPVRSPS